MFSFLHSLWFLWLLIFLELAQGFQLVTPDPFSWHDTSTPTQIKCYLLFLCVPIGCHSSSSSIWWGSSRTAQPAQPTQPTQPAPEWRTSGGRSRRWVLCYIYLHTFSYLNIMNGETLRQIMWGGIRINIYTPGTWLGDPRTHVSEERKVWIEGINADRVANAETISPSAEKLAINLLTVLFGVEELATGNCTVPKRSDIHLLDQKKIRAIRRESNLLY